MTEFLFLFDSDSLQSVLQATSQDISGHLCGFHNKRERAYAPSATRL